jgi:predicted hotdog family 3-hydroxylacyl-ACP dehydratase
MDWIIISIIFLCCRGAVMPESPIPIEALLPHRAPMLLIGKIVSFDERQAVTRSVVEDHWPLTTHEGANALVLLELVAQTAGVNNGYKLLHSAGHKGDQRGWIVGIKRSRLFVDHIALGEEIEVESVNSFEYDNFREVEGVARIGGKIVAQVTLQLIQAAQAI